MGQSSIPKTLTIARDLPSGDQAHSYGVVDSIEINAEAGGWVQFSSAIKARAGVTASYTPAFTSEKEFTSKHINVKLADTVANLGAATALKGASVKLSLERPSESFNPLGTSDTPEFERGVLNVTGELVLRYTDTQYETDFLANAIKAMEIKMANGTDAALTFTLGQVRYRELEKSSDKNEVITQTISFKGEYSLTDGKSVTALLNNKRATYEAA